MKRAQDPELTAEEATRVSVWERHIHAEFQAGDVDATMATMADDPSVNHFAVMTGGVGREGVRRFYETCFIKHHPPDTEIVRVARTVGKTRVVEELVHRFTHTIEMPWILPGVPPTGKRVELTVVVVVEYDGDRILNERIYWDQASLLVQVGLLDPAGLPVVGTESARKLLDPSLPSRPF